MSWTLLPNIITTNQEDEKPTGFFKTGYTPQIFRNVKEIGCQLLLPNTLSHWEDLFSSITWFDTVESNSISFLNKSYFTWHKSIALLKKQYGSHFKFKSISHAFKRRFGMQKILNTNPVQLTTIFLRQPTTRYTRYQLFPFITIWDPTLKHKRNHGGILKQFILYTRLKLLQRRHRSDRRKKKQLILRSFLNPYFSQTSTSQIQ